MTIKTRTRQTDGDRESEREREGDQSCQTRQREERTNKLFFFHLYCLSPSFSSRLPFLLRAWKKKKKNADAAFKAARNIYSALQRLSVLFIRCLMSERTWGQKKKETFFFFLMWDHIYSPCFWFICSDCQYDISTFLLSCSCLLLAALPCLQSIQRQDRCVGPRASDL